MKSADLSPGMEVFAVDWLGWKPAIVVEPKVYRSAFARMPYVALATPGENGFWVPRWERAQSVKSVADFEAHESARRAKNEAREADRTRRTVLHDQARSAADLLRRAGFTVHSTSISASGLVPLVTIDVSKLPHLHGAFEEVER